MRSRLQEIPFSSKKVVLDVACGISTLGKTFSDRVYGLDINPVAIQFAKNQGITVRLGDVGKKWNYPDNYFDIVIASHIIEHVVDPDHILSEAKRVLKIGGLLIIATPNLAAWFNRILLLLGIQPFFTEVSTKDKTLGLAFTKRLISSKSPMGHLRVFTLSALTDIIRLHGFTVVKISSMEFLSLPKLILVIDKLFSYIPTLASNIIVVAKKDAFKN